MSHDNVHLCYFLNVDRVFYDFVYMHMFTDEGNLYINLNTPSNIQINYEIVLDSQCSSLLYIAHNNMTCSHVKIVQKHNFA